MGVFGVFFLSLWSSNSFVVVYITFLWSVPWSMNAGGHEIGGFLFSVFCIGQFFSSVNSLHTSKLTSSDPIRFPMQRVREALRHGVLPIVIEIGCHAGFFGGWFLDCRLFFCFISQTPSLSECNVWVSRDAVVAPSLLWFVFSLYFAFFGRFFKCTHLARAGGRLPPVAASILSCGGPAG